MADEPKRGGSDTPLSDETTEAIKSQVIYGTGYAHPPKQHRFQKGNSGNPKGRPRRAPSDLSLAEQPMLNAVLNGAKKTVKMREGNKVTEVSMHDALVQAMYASALKGNARSLGLAIDLSRTADTVRAREIKQSNELWLTYQSQAYATIAAAKENGGTIPELLPHPDDIIIDFENGPRSIGPVDEDQLKATERTQRLCDVWIMQDVLDYRMVVDLNGKRVDDPGAARLFAVILNNSLPPRLRLSSFDIMMKQMRFERMPKRELLKLLFDSWRKLGRPRPRGYVSPKLGVVKKWLEDFVALKRGVDAGTLDADAMARGDFDQAALRFMEERGLH